MAKILLDYVFPISVVDTIPSANTAWLKQACLVVKPNSGGSAQLGNAVSCTSNDAVAALTDNEDAAQLFAAGMSKVYILPSNSLDVAEAMDDSAGNFFTVLVSSDFQSEVVGNRAARVIGDLTFEALVPGEDGDEISIELLSGGSAGSESVTVTGKKISVTIANSVSTATQISTKVAASAAAMALLNGAPAIAPGEGSSAQVAAAEQNLTGGADSPIDVGSFAGVVAMTSEDIEFLKVQAVKTNRCAFYGKDENGAENMCYAFGKLLSANAWADQQYIAEPSDDDVLLLGDALDLFNSKISFVITDDEFGTRLALFAAAGKAIRAPYVIKNLQIDMQSAALSWIAANQPSYTKVEATLLETRLQLDVINQLYIDTKQIESGTVEVSVVAGSNFTAQGDINIAEPKALWRVESVLTQS